MERFLAIVTLFSLANDSVSFTPPGSHHIVIHSTTKLNSIPTPIDTLTSGLASICRLPRGVTVSNDATRISNEEQPVLKQLFDIENDVECRKVRERITELDLNVVAVIPASPSARAVTDSDYEYAMPAKGKELPVLVVVDASKTKLTLSGSKQILEYLDDKFNVEPQVLKEETTKETILRVANTYGNYVASFLRIGRGKNVCGAAGPLAPRPDEPLVLYDYSGNQFSRLVREVLMELDLVYELRSVGKGSPRREEMAKETDGSTQCPYLMDPNTGVSIKESKAIIKYLYDSYALYTPPPELLEFASNNILFPIKPLVAILAKLQAGSGGSDEETFQKTLDEAEKEIKKEVASAPVVVYSYDLSPFTPETRAIFEKMNVAFEEISLGKEWMPGFISEGGSEKRAALLRMTGQSSLPHIFVGGKSIGGLYTGSPGLIPSLEQGVFMDLLEEANKSGGAKAVEKTPTDEIRSAPKEEEIIIGENKATKKIASTMMIEEEGEFQ